jgi:L-lactate dehydrogenase complex protein LldE
MRWPSIAIWGRNGSPSRRTNSHASCPDDFLYVDLFYPQVGIATLELLEKLKVDVVYPLDQTCCGQPMANSGCYEEARATEEPFIENFSQFDHVVTPSGSCTHHLRNKFTAASDSADRRKASANVHELVEFLHDALQVRDFPWATFEHKVALHNSCSAIRGLGLASMSERVHDPKLSKPKTLLEHVPGIQFADFERVDECCGFSMKVIDKAPRTRRHRLTCPGASELWATLEL